MKPLVCAFAFALLAGIPARAAPEGTLIDHVWAGHPVTFAFLTERGHQFIAYYDAGRRITIVGRKLGDANWTRVQPEGIPLPARKRDSNVVGWDSHNYLRLALDRDGCLHLSGNMHVDPLVYYRTSRPFDLTSLERIDHMTGGREARCTYPVFFKNAAGDLMFRYRDGQSGNGSDLYNLYDTTTRTWRRQLETPLLEGEGKRNAYALEPVLGPDGRFHLVWMWRESGDCATNNTLSYARSRDFVHWETSRGEPLMLPITRTTGDVIDAAKPGEGLINMTFNLGFDAQTRPLVVYHRYDVQRRSQAYIARPVPGDEGKHWEVSPISAWKFQWQFSGGGSIPAEVRLGPPHCLRDGSLAVDYSTHAAGSGRWILRPRSLERIATLPAPVPALPSSLRRASSADMEVQTLISRSGGKRWVLRWETMPRNRDRPRASAPPPSELRLFELSDGEVAAAERVGS